MKRSQDLKILQKHNSSRKSYSALFLDRDGVLIKEKHYLSDPNKVQLELGVLNLLRLAKSKKWITIVISNQSGIGRGFYSWEDYDKVTITMLNQIHKENLISAIFANSLVNSDSKESWRKPGMGMINESLKYFNINLERSILIGDRITDLQSGVNAGISNLVHILTGHGISERDNILKNINNDFFYYNGKRSKIRLFNNLVSLIESNFLTTVS